MRRIPEVCGHYVLETKMKMPLLTNPGRRAGKPG
jgi:hypothetical protein